MPRKRKIKYQEIPSYYCAVRFRLRPQGSTAKGDMGTVYYVDGEFSPEFKAELTQKYQNVRWLTARSEERETCLFVADKCFG